MEDELLTLLVLLLQENLLPDIWKRKVRGKTLPVRWIHPNVCFECIRQDELNVNHQVTAHQSRNPPLVVLFSYLLFFVFQIMVNIDQNKGIVG